MGVKLQFSWYRGVRYEAIEAAIVSLIMKNCNELSVNKQVPNANSQSAAILGRFFSITKSGLCVSVLLNSLDIQITIQRRRKQTGIRAAGEN